MAKRRSGEKLYFLWVDCLDKGTVWCILVAVVAHNIKEAKKRAIRFIREDTGRGYHRDREGPTSYSAEQADRTWSVCCV